MTPAKGFTLLELMIVVAIVAILAAIALPAFGRYAFRAHRVDGQELLLRIANAQERHYATNNTYGPLSGADGLGYTDPAASDKGYYNVTVNVVAVGGAAGQGYTATATPQNAQATDVCGDLSIDQAGVKLPAATDATHNTNGSCW